MAGFSEHYKMEMAQNFIAVTAAPSTEVAMYWLEAGNFNMESAIELYFSTSALPMPSGGNSGGNFDTSAAELGVGMRTI